MIVDGDWVRANGTTLGADNGIGVATIMALLSSTEIAHPPLEAMFTIDEETGMTGAKELDGSNFSGKILMNLDTEDDDEISIGCAGGIDTNTSYNYRKEKIAGNSKAYEIQVKGLIGGHSGMDIDKGRANANKLMTRILYFLRSTDDIQLLSFDGGSLRNAIPREATVKIATHVENSISITMAFQKIAVMLSEEWKTKEANLSLSINECSFKETEALESSETHKILNALYAVPNGVYRMSPDIDGLVETSSSLARVIIQDGKFITQSLQRSSVESTKDDVANTIRACFENMGCDVVQSGDYPGWQPNPNSKMVNLMADLYKEMYNEDPKIKACHAGLECGILSKHLPGVDMVSFGPNIRAAHSPDEKVQISSVQKFWDYLLEALNRLN
jgi:dipeptidase D